MNFLIENIRTLRQL